jgi:tripartite-type tricarboxylate transporter receptor subunit TctC
VFVFALVLILGMLVMSVEAASYPKSPINLIVPWGAGGGTDILARVVARHLEKHLPVPVPIVNIVGAGGAVGTDDVARSKADGYKLAI